MERKGNWWLKMTVCKRRAEFLRIVGQKSWIGEDNEKWWDFRSKLTCVKTNWTMDLGSPSLSYKRCLFSSLDLWRSVHCDAWNSLFLRVCGCICVLCPLHVNLISIHLHASGSQLDALCTGGYCWRSWMALLRFPLIKLYQSVALSSIAVMSNHTPSVPVLTCQAFAFV